MCASVSPMTVTQTSAVVPNMEKTQVGFCPSCGKATTFKRIGVQHWPLEIAKAAGLPPVIKLWQCGACQTTISENDLLF